MYKLYIDNVFNIHMNTFYKLLDKQYAPEKPDFCMLLIFSSNGSHAEVFALPANEREPKPEISKNFLLKDEYSDILRLISTKKSSELDLMYTGIGEMALPRALKEAVGQVVYIPLKYTENGTEKVTGCLVCGWNEKQDEHHIKLFYNAISGEILALIYRWYDSFYTDLRKVAFLFNTINLFSELMYVKDNPLLVHSYNVAWWSMILADQLKLEPVDTLILYFSAIFHDIGKIYIEDSIIKKPEALTPEEFKEIKNHSVYGDMIVNDALYSIADLSEVHTIVRGHHERFDGSGYPDGIKGNALSLPNRIVSAADTVDSMLSGHVYRKPSSIEHVIRELNKNRDKQFDGEVAEMLIRQLNKSRQTMIEGVMPLANWCSLTIYMKDRILNLQGIIAKTGTLYKFRMESKSAIQRLIKSDILKINLFIPTNRDITQYDTKLAFIEDNYIFFSEVSPQLEKDSFSLLWDLKGYISNPISIYRIGGKALCFYVLNSTITNNPPDNIYTVKVLFNSDTDIDIVGIIENAYTIGQYTYYTFRYVNLPPSTLDKVFRQLFRRQVEIRKL